MAIPLGFAVWGSLAGFVAIAAGCSPDKQGSSNDGTTATTGGTTSSSATDAAPMATLVGAMCDGFAECCNAQSNPFDRAACEAAATSAIEIRQPLGDAAVWHPEVVDECAGVLRSSLSACGEVPLDSVCDNVYSGTAPTGASCATSSDCAPVSGALVWCLVDTCVARRKVALGDTCTATCSEVTCDYFRTSAESGYEILACDAEAGLGCIDGVCAPLPTEGQPCFADGFCAPGHACVAATWSCAADAALGGACSDRRCTQGGWCSDGTCVALLATGETCYKAEQCQSGVCDFDDTDTYLFCLPAGPGTWDAADCAGSVSF